MNSTLSVTLLALTLATTPALAAQTNWQAELKTARIYSDNLKVKELEQASGQSDQGWQHSASVSARWQSGDHQLNWNSLLQLQRWQHSPEFDTRLWIHSLDWSTALADWRGGLMLNYADADVAAQDFLQLYQPGLYLARLWPSGWYQRASWQWSGKQFAALADRDARQHQLRWDQFWFSTDGRQRVQMAGAYQWERAHLANFSYQGPALELSWAYTQAESQRQWKVKAGYQWRDYQAPWSEQEPQARQDRQSYLGLGLDWTLWRSLALQSSLEQQWVHSSTDSLNYRQLQLQLGLSYKFSGF